MELVCSQCYDGHHLKHQTRPLALCYDACGSLEDLLTMAQQRITMMNDTARNIQLTISQLKNKVAKVMAEICDDHDIDCQMYALSPQVSLGIHISQGITFRDIIFNF